MHIENDGPLIVATDYWSTELARRGVLYLSINAGTLRFLVPPAAEEEVLGAVATAQMAIITRGPYEGRDSIEVLLDDGSDTPYVVFMDARMVDRLWPQREDGRGLPVHFYVSGRGGTKKTAELAGGVRRSGRLPDLRPWQ